MEASKVGRVQELQARIRAAIDDFGPDSDISVLKAGDDALDELVAMLNDALAQPRKSKPLTSIEVAQAYAIARGDDIGVAACPPQAECRCDGNPSGGSCRYPDCKMEPPTTEELLTAFPPPEEEK